MLASFDGRLTWPIEFEGLPLLLKDLAVGHRPAAMGIPSVDQGGLAEGVPEQSPHRLEVLGMLLQIQGSSEVAEGVGRHMHPKAIPNDFDDLIRQSLLRLGVSSLGDEERPIWISIEPRQHMLAVPAYALGYVFRDFGDHVFLLGLRLRGGDMKQETPLGSVRLAEVPPPDKRT